MRMLLAVMMCVVAASASAQTVLEIDAVVLDSRGRPVDALAREDFEVHLDGQPVAISDFFASQGKSNVPSLLIVFVDDVHLQHGTRLRVVNALERFIQTGIAPSTSMMIVRWNGMHASLMEPTQDRGVLLGEIAKLKKSFSNRARVDAERRRLLQKIVDAIDERARSGGDQSIVAERLAAAKDGYKQQRIAEAVRGALLYADERMRDTEGTLEALLGVAADRSAISGRKVLLYVSESLPLQPAGELLHFVREAFREDSVQEMESLGLRLDQTQLFRSIGSSIKNAGFVFSAMDPAGRTALDDGNPVGIESRMKSLNLSSAHIDDSAGMRMLVRETGGRFIENTNDVDHAFNVLADEASSFYAIGVRSGASDGNDIRVRVRGRDDLRVITSRRRSSTGAPELIASAIRARLHSREESNPLEARIALATPWPQGEKCVGAVQVAVPYERLKLNESSEGAISIHAVALDGLERETPVRTMEKSVTLKEGQPLVESLMFAYLPQRYVVSLAIVDRTSGEISYLQADVDAGICGK